MTDLEHQDAAAAHETLEEIRDVLASLRQRNGVVVFSDHMNAYHAQMEKVLGDGPVLLKSAVGVFDLTQQTGVLAYLAGRLEREAPASLRADEQFVGLLAALKQSVAALQGGLARGDTAACETALAGLKAPYARLFVKFG